MAAPARATISCPKVSILIVEGCQRTTASMNGRLRIALIHVRRRYRIPLHQDSISLRLASTTRSDIGGHITRI